MPDLNQQQTPDAALQSGDPAYQQQQFQAQQRMIAPQYAQAIQQARQNSQNRGLYNSGLGQEEEQGLTGQFLQQTNANAQGAAQTGADQAEYNRRQDVARQFALQQQAIQAANAQKLAEQGQNFQQQQQWNDLLSQTGGAVAKAALI